MLARQRSKLSISGDRGVDCPLRFPGQYLDDETGLHHNLHRYYDPDTAGYLIPDPLGLVAALNDHGYVLNPFTYLDRNMLGQLLPRPHRQRPEGGRARL